jgi:2-polyprenyl-3-methyl-5-hydroxy-6-metoxy-1,4-benzoquinol methylase
VSGAIADREQAGVGAVRFQSRMDCELRKECLNECRQHWQRVVSLEDHESGPGEFDVFFCRRCKLGFTEPYPTEETVGHLYETRESRDFALNRHSPIDLVKDFLSRREIARIAPHRGIRSVLDYATGNGRFAVSAARVFRDACVDAVDYQTTPPPLLQSRFERVSYFTVTEFAERRQQYDLIVLRHVLEHTHYPVQLVARLADRLASNGVLYIEVPNLDSGCAKVFGKYWPGYYVPRHIFHYTVDSLSEVVRRAGLEGEIGRNEMPWMGNLIAILTGTDKASNFVRLCGILLHPLQLIVEAIHRSSTCINARCRHGNARIER